MTGVSYYELFFACDSKALPKDVLDEMQEEAPITCLGCSALEGNGFIERFGKKR